MTTTQQSLELNPQLHDNLLQAAANTLKTYVRVPHFIKRQSATLNNDKSTPAE